MSEDVGAKLSARRERLVQRRKSLGLTQEDLAGVLNVERSTVVRWERGESEPLPYIRPRLARTLKVPAERLGELLSVDGPLWPGSAVPRQLPAAVADFTGRAAELGLLTRMMGEAREGVPGTVVISAIGGTAGVGKTALALYWAHQVASRFTDGQLYVNLRGFDLSGTPATPAEAVRGFLDALGIPPDRVPRLPDAQAGMYRSLLADRKMLIVLDNARDEQQVRPLLPASPGSLVLVTSRSQLSGLAAADGARLLSLDVLTHAEAVQLLTARLGAGRAAADLDAAAEVADLCACLPLALAVAAARAGARPGLPLPALAAELRGAAGRLDALDLGDPTANVRSVFSWSYDQLSSEGARMFRLLGLHPGPDISVPGAASLAGTGEPEALRLLRELTRAQLIAERAPGRYAFHDLLRAYAASLASDSDSEAERAAAIGRILDHYLHTAAGAVLLVHPTFELITLAPPQPGTTPEQFPGRQEAMAWFDAEFRVLLAAANLAAESGFDVLAWQIPWAIGPYLALRGHFQERLAAQRTALAAATRRGDIAGQALCTRLLANATVDTGDKDRALIHFTTSIELYRRVGNAVGEARVHHNLNGLAEKQGRYADALSHAEQSLRIFRAIGHKAGEARALHGVGWDLDLLGDYERARSYCRQALALNAEVGDRNLDAQIWDSLGYAEHHLANFGEAIVCYRQALSAAREMGERWVEAWALTHIGDTHHAVGEQPQARDAWQHALVIFEDLQHPDADQVRAKLASLDTS